MLFRTPQIHVRPARSIFSNALNFRRSAIAPLGAEGKFRRAPYLRRGRKQSGEAIETGIVGADGLVGGDAAINGHAFRQVTVQLDGAGLTMPKAKFI